ncbi:MAG: hypothetical protein ACYDCC_06410 [Actinomycetota bacterium]
MIKLIRTRGFLRVLFFAIIAAMILPGGAAVSSYSYPPPPPPPQFNHSVTLDLPWSDAHHFEDTSCGLLSKCTAAGTATASDGNMVADTSVESPLKGLGPDLGSSAEANGSMHIVDNFDDPTVHVVLYRFYLSINHAAFKDSQTLPSAGFHNSNAFVDFAEGAPCGAGQFTSARKSKGAVTEFCNNGARVYFWPDAVGLLRVDVEVFGTFDGREDMYTKLTSQTSLDQGASGRARTFADVSIVRVDRLWGDGPSPCTCPVPSPVPSASAVAGVHA